MAERGRKPGFTMSESHRVKIKNSNILNALIEHVEGKREMSSTQVTAGVALLKKVMPDLAASADVGDNGQLLKLKTMSDAELNVAIAAALARGETSEDYSGEPGGMVH
jgi:hypothetical protein